MFVDFTHAALSPLVAFRFRQIQTEAELQIFHVRYFDLLTCFLFR